MFRRVPKPVGDDLSNISIPYAIAEHPVSNMDLVSLPSESDWGVTQVHFEPPTLRVSAAWLRRLGLEGAPLHT